MTSALPVFPGGPVVPVAPVLPMEPATPGIPGDPADPEGPEAPENSFTSSCDISHTTIEHVSTVYVSNIINQLSSI